MRDLGQEKKVQEDIDSVNKGAIVDSAKLSGFPVTKDEITSILTDAAQLITGFKPDAVDGNYWSEWDESVLQRIIEMLRKIYG